MDNKERTVNKYVSVDCVIFGFDFEKLNVLLLDRKLMDPENGLIVFGDKTLAGNHVYMDEDLDEAAHRILQQLTGLDNIYLAQFKTFGSPTRTHAAKDQRWLKAIGYDPNINVITVGYYSLVNTFDSEFDLRNADNNPKWYGRNPQWYPVDGKYDLAYDHQQILDEALHTLREHLMNYQIGFELLPEKFTLSQLQKLYEIILGVTVDKRNFRKKLRTVPYLIPLDEMETGVKRKPGKLYKIDRDLYEKYNKHTADFSF